MTEKYWLAIGKCLWMPLLLSRTASPRYWKLEKDGHEFGQYYSRASALSKYQFLWHAGCTGQHGSHLINYNSSTRSSCGRRLRYWSLNPRRSLALNAPLYPEILPNYPSTQQSVSSTLRLGEFFQCRLTGRPCSTTLGHQVVTVTNGRPIHLLPNQPERLHSRSPLVGPSSSLPPSLSQFPTNQLSSIRYVKAWRLQAFDILRHIRLLLPSFVHHVFGVIRIIHMLEE